MLGNDMNAKITQLIQKPSIGLACTEILRGDFDATKGMGRCMVCDTCFSYRGRSGHSCAQCLHSPMDHA